MYLAAGSRVGPYEIIGLLGTGGMGAVYRARDPRLGRDVAVKTLFQDAGDRARFEVEARAASQLTHPNIVSLFDIGEEEGSPYIVFELLDGDPLRSLLGGRSDAPAAVARYRTPNRRRSFRCPREEHHAP
jgi:serine/threonine protein kinase